MIISLFAEKQLYFKEKAKSEVTQKNLSFLSWCKIFSHALYVWTSQNQPEFEEVKYWTFYLQANMLNMLLIIVSTESITHVLWTGIQVLIILSLQPLCWVAQSYYTDYLTFQKINGLSLNVVRVGPLSKINSFSVFLLAVLKETVYTHYATLFYEARSFKNEEEWGRLSTEAMPRKTERNGNIMKW